MPDNYVVFNKVQGFTFQCFSIASYRVVLIVFGSFFLIIFVITRNTAKIAIMFEISVYINRLLEYSLEIIFLAMHND